MRRLQDFTTVESCLDGDIILIGEEHGNAASARLASDVLDEVEPGAIAYEQPPASFTPSSAAMGTVTDYACGTNKPCVAIDIKDRGKRFREAVKNRAKLTSVANTFTHEIESDGDLDERAVWDARAAVKNQFGVEAWRVMYPLRETEMARHLLTMRREYDGPIVAAIGAFHVPSVAQFLAHEEPFDEIDDKRVKK